MTIYKKALIAIDLRDQQPPLITKVKKICQSISEVHLCSAIEPIDMMYPVIPLEGAAIDGGELQRRVEEQATSDLHALANELNLPVQHTHLLLGKPAVQIKTLAKEGEFDLIIIGTHGKSATRALLGSTSNGVMHGAPCDVLALKYQFPS